MITYTLLQHYWWFLIGLLAGLLVFLMFVQGANSLLLRLGGDAGTRALILNSTGRKWELTFTTLVTFGGAFFAAFPLFYSTSFGGAYWVWMLLLVTFVLQAVSYEFQGKAGNLLGAKTYHRLLVLNGFAGPFIVGAAVGTFFTGSPFVVEKSAMGAAGTLVPAISRWTGGWHGLEALAEPMNLVLGFTVVFLARTLGSLYLINNIDDSGLQPRLRRQVAIDALPFVLFFLTFAGLLLARGGFGVAADGTVVLVPHKYLDNLLSMPAVALTLLAGTVLVLAGIGRTLLRPAFVRGIWLAGPGTVMVVLALFLLAGYNGTAYYPSTADLQSSLTIANSCSSEFTLEAMSWVSLCIPFVLAYIGYAWHAIDRRSLTREELEGK